MEVVDAGKLKVGDGKYLNVYHQLKDEGDITKKQQEILDDSVYNLYLEKDDVKLREQIQRNNKKRTLQKADVEMM